jgi:glucose-1-phosphate adenylyltransferase
VTTEVFAYRPAALLETLESLAEGDEPLEDFGDALLPRLVDAGRAYAFPLAGYWRDVGTPESYWQAHQDLLSGDGLDLDDLDWRIMTRAGHRPPALIESGATVKRSLVSPACRVAGRVVRSVLSPGVVVEAGAVVEESVILQDAVIVAGALVERAIVDAGVEVPAGEHVHGTDPDSGIAIRA